MLYDTELVLFKVVFVVGGMLWVVQLYVVLFVLFLCMSPWYCTHKAMLCLFAFWHVIFRHSLDISEQPGLPIWLYGDQKFTLNIFEASVNSYI